MQKNNSILTRLKPDLFFDLRTSPYRKCIADEHSATASI